MPLTIIAAMSENRVIGRHGNLPWRLPDDFKRFKRLTRGHHVIMGRKTFESLPGGALTDRVNLVITRQAGYAADGAIVMPSLEAALARAAGDDQPFILGGGEIYIQSLPLVERLELTIVHLSVEGDTYFPDINFDEWLLVHEERHEADDRHAHPFSYRTYDRKHNDT